MSIVIEFYPAKASRKSLRDFLLAEGFNSCDYFLKPFPKGSLYYSWFNKDQYRSLDGVEAIIHLKEGQSLQNKWMLFTRTRVWASAYDRQKQNEIIRNARRLFGGHFYNDSVGKNKYTVIDKSEYLLPQESGIFQVYERIKSQIYELKDAIEDHKDSIHFDLEEGTHKDIVALVKSRRPSIALYNSLLPFLVSALEHYFRELFTVLIEFDEVGHSRLQELKLKDVKEINTVGDLYKLTNKERKIENLVAKGYNFQNLEVITKTFKDYLNIDIRKILKTQVKIGKKNIWVFDEVDEIIQRRHWMIHHFGFSTDVDKDKYIYFMSLINHAIDLVTSEIETTKGFKIIEHSLYYRLAF